MTKRNECGPFEIWVLIILIVCGFLWARSWFSETSTLLRKAVRHQQQLEAR